MLVISPVYASISYGGVFYNNPSKLKKVALTFDDGPHPRYTKQIIEILNEYSITATFFVIGVNAQIYPEALKEIASGGYELANHTFSHKSIKKMSSVELRNEILKCEQTIFELSGVKTNLFRPPEGACVPESKCASEALNYNTILWSIDTLDWAHTSPEIIAENVLTNLKDGDIILMHDYVSKPNTTCDALKILIPQILKQGYEFVTVSELIK